MSGYIEQDHLSERASTGERERYEARRDPGAARSPRGSPARSERPRRSGTQLRGTGRLRLAGLCLVAVFAVGMAVSAGTASAAKQIWEQCSEGGSVTKYTEHQCKAASGTGKSEWNEIAGTEEVRLKGTLRFKDTKVPVLGTAEVECNGESTGVVGPGKLGKITEVKITAEHCKGIKVCEEIKHFEGRDLPWQAELYETEGKQYDKLIGDGKGEPGWKVECKTSIGTQTDECLTESEKPESLLLENKLTNGELLVLATFQHLRKAKCSQGGAESGEITGSIGISKTNGTGLRTGSGGGVAATPTSLTTTLAGEGKEGETITVLEGSKVKDKATLSGTNASKAGGTVTYKVYSDKECKTLVAEAGEVTVTSGSVPASNEEKLEGGTYYWQAAYSGDTTNQASTSACGSEIVRVTPPYTSREGYGCANPGAPNIKQLCVSGINTATGDLTLSQGDLSVRGRGPGLYEVRTYNSQLAAEQTEHGPFGYGWTGSYSAHLVEETEKVTVYQDNGSAVVFHFNKTAKTYTPGSWVEATLAKEGSTYVYTLPDQTKLEFNSSGQLTEEVDRNGNPITLEYNTEKQLASATDGAARKITFTYKAGLVESVEDPMKHVVKYTYEANNLKSVTGPETEKWEFTYGTSHQLESQTDPRKNTTTTAYASNRVSSQTDPLKRKRSLEYAGTETKLTEPNGSTTVELFNTAGLPTSITLASGEAYAATTTYEYNGSYDLIATTDPNKHTTKYGYNATDDLTSELDPNKNETKWTYDSTHDVITTTTPRGETTTTTRNGAGDAEVVERAIGAEKQTTEYRYTEKGEVDETIDPLHHATKYGYDTYGDLASETDPEGNERTWEYNADSQEISEVSPRGNVKGGEPEKFTTKTKRDARGRPLEVTDPLGHTTTYVYDADGDLEKLTDGNEHTTKYTYNADDEQTKTEEPNGIVTETGYDTENQVASYTDGRKDTWEYKRDLLEEVIEEVNPLKRVTKKKYDKAGNLEAVEDPEKNTTTYKYDPGNRLEEVSYSTGKPSAVKYEYNADGQVGKMTDGTGETVNTYDELDRLKESKNGAGKIVKYEYNLDNEPTKITYPNEKSITREYDNDARLKKVTDWNSKETTFSYNPDSKLEKTVFPTSTEDEDKYTYNDADQMSEIKMMKGAETLGSLVYERDKDAQVKKTTTKVLPGEETVEDTYDENNRLIDAAATEYKYDKSNDPTKIGSNTYAYNTADELETGTEKTVGVAYTYNEDGQRTKTKPSSGPATSYGYDQAGNLTTVERPEEATEKIAKIEDSFTYDGNNLRASQKINGTTTHLTWDTAEALPLILEDETNSFIYGPENLPIEQISSGGTTLYYHHDQQGSTRLLTGSTGKTEATYTYSPYGTITEKTGAATTPLLYDGQYTTNPDTSAELIYLHARTYDPKTAEFLSIDPALETTGEPYTYTKDNPPNAADPSGLETWGYCFGNVGSYTVTVCLVKDGNGRVGVTISGAGAINFQRVLVADPVRTLRSFTTLGGSYQRSNAATIDGLRGPFTGVQSTATFGVWGFSVAAAYETFSDGAGVTGTTYTVGGGAGGVPSLSIDGTISSTLVIPIPAGEAADVINTIIDAANTVNPIYWLQRWGWLP
jgi:RHS repeat-associated protein